MTPEKSSGSPFFLREKRAFEAVLTGGEALARAVLESRTRAAVISPEFPCLEVFRLFRRVFEAAPEGLRSGTGVRTAVQQAFRSAMEGDLTALLFGKKAVAAVEKALGQIGGFRIPGGLVMVVEGEWEGGAGRVAFEPACPEEIYRFYKTAAAMAAARESYEVIVVPTHLWTAAMKLACGGVEAGPEEDQSCGPDGYRAAICPDCCHYAEATVVKEILASLGVGVRAMGCRTRACDPGIGDPAPESGCHAAGIWMETARDRVRAAVGDKRALSRGLPWVGAWESREDRTLILLETGRPGQEGTDEGGSDLALLRQTAREMGMERIFSCGPCSREGLASLVEEAMALPTSSAVIGCILETPNPMGQKEAGDPWKIKNPRSG